MRAESSDIWCKTNSLSNLLEISPCQLRCCYDCMRCGLGLAFSAVPDRADRRRLGVWRPKMPRLWQGLASGRIDWEKKQKKITGIPMKIAAGCASGANGKRLCHLKKKKKNSIPANILSSCTHTLYNPPACSVMLFISARHVKCLRRESQPIVVMWPVWARGVTRPRWKLLFFFFFSSRHLSLLSLYLISACASVPLGICGHKLLNSKSRKLKHLKCLLKFEKKIFGGWHVFLVTQEILFGYVCNKVLSLISTTSGLQKWLFGSPPPPPQSPSTAGGRTSLTSV